MNYLGAGTQFWSSGAQDIGGRQMAKPKGHEKNYYLLFKEVLAMSTTWIFKSIGHCNGVSD